MNRITEIANHADVSENAIESYLVKKVEQEGGIALKYTNPYQAGFPDRLVLMPEGKMCWVEVKSKGKKPRMLQIQRHEQLIRLGYKVFVIDSREKVDKLINGIKQNEYETD